MATPISIKGFFLNWHTLSEIVRNLFYRKFYTTITSETNIVV